MDSTLIAAVISGLGAALATAGGAVLRARTNTRTAARRIYAELTRNRGDHRASAKQRVVRGGSPRV
ncbi:hypothetical protein ACFYWY_35770 [Streptomyces sp. NPDC002870]|uniref:hypothetical protein n=1 Tax=Streptomyces sp. NPDC002870 TaxID=3364666 RepID=UPI00369948B1